MLKDKKNNINVLAKRLYLVGDPHRIKIICSIIDHKNSCVSDIAKDLKSSVAIVSHHLQILTDEGILSRIREGKKIFYRISKNSFTLDLKRLICKCK